MSPIDAAWLRMDSAAQHLVIMAAFHFATPLSHVEVRGLLGAAVRAHPRLGQRVALPLPAVGTPHWEEVPDFDPGTHLSELTLPPSQAPSATTSPQPADDDARLAELLGELASRPLDLARPLWAVHLVEGHAAGPILVVRLHHAIGDGVHLVQLLLALTDHADVTPPTVGLAMPHPHGLWAQARTVAEHAAALARMTLLPGDAPTVLRGALGPRKRVAWTRGFALEGLREAAHAHDAKLNDLLVAVTAGALRRYLLAREGIEPPAELRALVPVYLRAAAPEAPDPTGVADTSDLGNHFGLVFLPLHVGTADPHARVRAAKQASERVKASPDALVAFELLGAMGVAGPALENAAIDLFTRKATCMITNVPGPSGTLRLAGRPLLDLRVWAPVAGHIGLGISLLTYAGQVRVGFLADARLIPDPDALADAWEAEVAYLTTGTLPS